MEGIDNELEIHFLLKLFTIINWHVCVFSLINFVYLMPDNSTCLINWLALKKYLDVLNIFHIKRHLKLSQKNQEIAFLSIFKNIAHCRLYLPL